MTSHTGPSVSSTQIDKFRASCCDAAMSAFHPMLPSGFDPNQTILQLRRSFSGRTTEGAPAVKEVSVVNRALEIAPECSSISELNRRLIREGHRKVNKELSAWQTRRKLTATLGTERDKA